jgi:hypothetical protein
MGQIHSLAMRFISWKLLIFDHSFMFQISDDGDRASGDSEAAGSASGAELYKGARFAMQCNAE